MNSMIIIAVLAVFVSSTQAGAVGHGAIISGPSGIVTPAGPIGPHALGLGYGHGGLALAGPALGYGYGLGLGYGGGAVGYGGGAIGYGGGAVGYGAHGIAIKGPATVPTVISGPAGKIYAEGLYGVPHYGHYY